MSTRRTAGLPGRLERTRRRFERWRRSRKKRTPIPDPLWAAAVEAADEYGVSRTASALRVDYYSLKCARPNCDRTFDRIMAVEISGSKTGFCRIVENFGEDGADGPDLTAAGDQRSIRQQRVTDRFKESVTRSA